MADEFDGYRDTVLDPARRAGNVLPRDLFTRYRLDPNQVRDEAEFTRRVERVVKYWRKIKMQRKYLTLATALLSADTELRRKARLNYEFFQQQREEARSAARSRLDARVAAIAESTPCLTPAGLRRLVVTLEGAYDEHEIRAALSAHKVTIVDPPWDIVGSAPIGTARSLRAPLTALSLRLSPEVLFGADAVRAGFTLRAGFRLEDGRTVTRDRLIQFREEHSRSKHDERKTAIDNVLAILVTAVASGDTLPRLLQWEVQEQLRPDVEAGLPVRAIAHAAEELGLVPAEAMELAATLSGAGGTTPESGGIQDAVIEALRAGELSEAAALLAQLPTTQAVAEREQLNAMRHEVAELVTSAEQADGEDAARLLAAAAAIARDDDTLRARLAAIAPPPPTAVQARQHAGRVAVRWTPSAARTSGVRYRVVRTSDEPAVSAGGGGTVGETEANEILDAVPTAARPTYYTVFASRGDTVWSAGASDGPIELLPAVGDIELCAASGSVSGTWRAHDEAAEVLITRTDRAAPEAPVTIPAPAEGVAAFTDRNVTNGRTYDYTFRAVYLTRSGQRRMSEPVLASATPAEPPGHLRDFGHDVRAGSARAELVVGWALPEHGTVELRISGDAPPWPVDTLIDRASARGFGQSVRTEAAEGAPGRQAVSMPAPQGRVVLTAFVTAGAQARVGASVTITMADAVTNLKADRFDEQIRLRWSWPAGANLARVTWWPAGTDAGVHGASLDVSQRVYGDSGGVRLDAGTGPVAVSVATVVRDRDGEILSVPVLVDVSEQPTAVTYFLQLAGRLPRRRYNLVLTCDRSCHLPALVVVHRADGIMPLRPDSGIVVARVEARHLTAGLPVSVALPIGIDRSSGLACFVDPQFPSVAEVTLVLAPAR